LFLKKPSDSGRGVFCLKGEAPTWAELGFGFKFGKDAYSKDARVA
jgi:hypothetical protein